MTPDPFDYSRPGPVTALGAAHIELAAGLGRDPIAICTAVQGLVIEPADAAAAGLPEARLAERNIRPARAIIDVLTALEPLPLQVARDASHRVVGTCRHYAVLSCALLRHHGIAARVRCGFATYFVAGKSVDHWVVEYRRGGEGRWVRVDTELIGESHVSDPTDLAPGEFLTGGEAWSRNRAGDVDPNTFGVVGVDDAWGIGEIRGNAIRDLASLCKLEMLPWDEWGRMDDSYHGRTGPDYDLLIDDVASACASNDPRIVLATYLTEDLAVPETLVT